MNKRGYYLGLISVLFLLVLFGCKESNTDMQNFINQTKNRKTKPIEPLPLFKQFQPYKYTAANLRNPFEPYVAAKAEAPTPLAIKGPGPDMKRPKDPLEYFPLDALKMVGTISRGKMKYALVKDPHGLVHRVGVGNYMGLNFGKILNITETTIEIREWINLQGNYKEKDVLMHLSS